MCALKNGQMDFEYYVCQLQTVEAICDCIWTGLLAALSCRDALLQMSVKDAEGEAQPIP